MTTSTRIATTPATIKAGGGIVCRPGPAGMAEVLIVHRPGYDDWSLPKGKVEPGEMLEAAALREVEEETGLACEIVRPFGSTSYLDRKGRDKVATYWLMRPLEGVFRPTDEVDEVRWLTLEEAVQILSYDRDRELLLSGRLGAG